MSSERIESFIDTPSSIYENDSPIWQPPQSHPTVSEEPYGSLVPFAEPSWYSRPNPYYNASHHQLRGSVRAWTDEYLIPNAFKWEEAGEVDPKAYRAAAEAGILVPLAFGNRIPSEWVDKQDRRGIIGNIEPREWNGFHEMVINDEINRVGGFGPAMGLFVGLQLGVPPIYNFGSEELKARVLPGILRGDKRICLATSEPDAGSDVKNIGTTAVLSPDGKHYIVNGTKQWINNGAYSDWFTTSVRTSGKPGDINGISMLLIPRCEGVTTTKLLMGGQWSSGICLLTFKDVKVPVENLIGKEGQAFKYIMFNFNRERLWGACMCIRMARVCIEDSMAWAAQRRVFEKTLLQQPVIRTKFANMARVVECQQAWIESLIFQIEHMTLEEANIKLAAPIALLKANASMVLERVARDAVQIFGGRGYMRGGPAERVERVWRDVKGASIPGGSEEVMLDFGIRHSVKVAQGQGARL
ncbi:hypothetical protein BOTBODRAFT_391386 [Botryobasidium botryosum FD-172 SS1]|uniref:Acyl-CoA dehydrogenase n=1 Tax=Botryobasidium botryosum (strain FD-172 SS1) TaxID=930990 RepID=A0A067MZV5_BOTB1|nr:hypothetical protein BOTBODRAFT_391386 [Botryobasidium botryosum FD-172 SS1]